MFYFSLCWLTYVRPTYLILVQKCFMLLSFNASEWLTFLLSNQFFHFCRRKIVLAATTVEHLNVEHVLATGNITVKIVSVMGRNSREKITMLLAKREYCLYHDTFAHLR